MGGPAGDLLKPGLQGAHTQRSPSPLSVASEDNRDQDDDTSAAEKRTPEIAYQIKTPGQALHDAVSRNDLDGVARILRASGPRFVDARNQRGRTALHVAAQGGQNEMAKLLLSKGADVDARSKGKYTPLHFAAEASRHDVVLTLLDAGADLEPVTREGYTPLHKAAMKEGKSRQDIVVILLARGANCAAFSREGLTPLQTAVVYGKVSNARVLCAFGADPFLESKHGYNAFHYTGPSAELGAAMEDAMRRWEECGKKTRKILKQLSKFVTKEGRVDVSEMLSFVAGVGHSLLVEFILDYMAKDNPDIVESEGLKKGWRPIHHAAWAGQSNVCEVLLRHGADVNIRTCTSKWTPLHLAAWKGRQRTVGVLLGHGADMFATAELTPPWKIDVVSPGPQLTVVLTLAQVTSFWLAAGGRHPKTLAVLQEFALRIIDDQSRIAAIDDYKKARDYLARLTKPDDDHHSSSNDEHGRVEPVSEVGPLKTTPSPLLDIDLPGTSGSFDGTFFSVQATRYIYNIDSKPLPILSSH
jgi:ankyrin repeat protein